MEIISVRSITGAQRGQQLLARAGIRSSVVRTPAQFSDSGCGYSLQIYGGAARAREILEQAGIALPARYGMDRR